VLAEHLFAELCRRLGNVELHGFRPRRWRLSVRPYNGHVESLHQEVLWHYTNAAGVFGIISSGLLRLTDMRFVNDRTEASYGSEKVLSLLTDLHVSRAMHMSTYMIDRILECLDGGRLYACSFSERNDSLSQWQRYGAGGEGYCIGFDASQLQNRSRTPHTLLVRVIYEEPEQERHIMAVITGRSSTAPAEREEGAFGAAIIDGLALQLKNPLFRDEHEWRLIHIEGRSEGSVTRIKTAVGGSYIKAFVEIDFGEETSRLSTLPIVSVVCGPKLEAELAESGVRELLAAYDYGPSVQVSSSELHATWR
jgi:hypothetical protein